MNGCYAERHIRVLTPVLLRNNLIAALRAVSVRINKPWDNGFTRCVYFHCIIRNGHIATFTHCFNAVVFNQHNAIFNHLLGVVGIAHGYHFTANQSFVTRWLVSFSGKRQIHTFSYRLRQRFRCAINKGKGFIE